MSYCNMATKNKNTSRISQFKIWHAEVLIMQKNYSAAILQLKKAEKLIQQNYEVNKLASIYYFLGTCYLEKTSTNISTEYLQKSLQIAKRHHMHHLENKIQTLFSKEDLHQKEFAFAALSHV